MRDFIELFVNGKPCRVSGEKTFWTLSDYLRIELGLVGTKIVCSEGDCGGCSVLIGRRQVDSRQLHYQSADSCILFMHQLDQTHVVSIEGLGTPNELSAVQKSMIDCHGSQCGYCTPGFVVAMHGLFEEQDRACRKRDQALCEDSLRLGLSGNLCRCTGYVQIVNAGRAVSPSEVPEMNQWYPAEPMLVAFDDLDEQPIQIHSGEHHVFVPNTLQQTLDFKANNPAARIVSGATDVGVQHNHGRPRAKTTLCLSQVNELSNIVRHDDALQIGCCATWTQILPHAVELYPDFAEVLLRFGSPQIRNFGTFGGNLANASPIADSIPFLYAMDATLILLSSQGERQVPIRDFYLGYKQLDLRDNEIIASIRCPIVGKNETLKLYKVSKRRDMDISTFTAAFLIGQQDNTITHARVAIGGAGPTVLRAPKAETAMTDQPLSLETMCRAGVIARDEITPISDVRGSDAYRYQLAENIFAKCYHDLTGSGDAPESLGAPMS